MPTFRAALACCLLSISWLAAGCSDPLPAYLRVPGGEAERGRVAIQRYGCAACHTIPGITGQSANVGPPLSHMAERAYVAGLLPNTPQQLMRWLRNPPEVDPRTAMPNLGVSDAEAADIATYLYSAK
jgi:cytochrome c